MSKYIEEIEITNYDDLMSIIQGKHDEYNKDLRDEFIFRGVEDIRFPLIPSALREDKINDYVDENFKIRIKLEHEKAIGIGLGSHGKNIGNRVQYYKIDKYMNLISEEINDTVFSLDELQFRKEFNALMNFLNTADKVGLKIPTNQLVRNFIEHETNENFKNIEFWPDENFYELISLAQHYGVPTRALDWSYDFRVSLYFVVKNILVDNYETIEKPENGVLWAYNYKHFEKERLSLSHNPFKIQFYRPEYNTNPNLNAQKGLFTFVINDLHNVTRDSFDQFIVGLLEGNHSFKNYAGKRFLKAPNNEKAFYKFIIPEEIKPQILNELYKDGYSEEYLFPGYGGVTKFIENKIKLDKLLNNSNSQFNRNISNSK